MNSRGNSWRRPARQRAFTLIELLTVIAIITLLISLLLPALGKARDSAKNVRTRATLKGMGEGLEVFVTENARAQQQEGGFDETRTTGGYPPSAARDDPTEDGQQLLFGAQWIVRYLVGKDQNGYIPWRNGKRNDQEGWEQKDWYISGLDRAGPYLNPDGLTLRAPKDPSLDQNPQLPGAPASPPSGVDDASLRQPVAVDSFDMPILYYAADVRAARRSKSYVASYGVRGQVATDGPHGIYSMMDNALFTGACSSPSGGCDYPPWDLAQTDSTTPETYPFSYFGPQPPTADSIASAKGSFCYTILDKNAFEASEQRTVRPYNPESYLLITPGKDGIYGTSDDVTNF